jgi:putative NIF3 family GTP cyclohydrolase 1 type 2
MDRKDFLKSSFLSALGVSLVSKAHGWNIADIHGDLSSEITTAHDLNLFLRSLAEVEEPSVDRIVIGNPGTKIRKIGTCWLPDWDTLKWAVGHKVNVLVVHEPTFYTHWDLDNPVNDFYQAPEKGRNQYVDLVERKKRWILENELVIIRCHDVLDKLNRKGISFALGNALGFSPQDIISGETYYQVYRTKPGKAVDVARYIAQKLKTFNQPGVAFYGDENRLVSSVGIGTGCICDPLNFSHLEPDMFLAITDVVRTWIQASYAKDSGKPLVVIDHGTSEEPGIVVLSGLLRESIPAVETVHFAQGCTYRWIE